MKNKKGQVMTQLGNLGIGVAVLAIVLVVAFLIMSTAKTEIQAIDGTCAANGSTCSTSFNATSDLQNATAIIPTFVPIVVIAVIGAALVGLVALFRRGG